MRLTAAAKILTRVMAGRSDRPVDSPSKRYRQRCSDGVVLPDAPRHVGQQAQCHLPITMHPASAIASDASDGVLLPTAIGQLGQQAHRHLPIVTLQASAIASVAGAG